MTEEVKGTVETVVTTEAVETSTPVEGGKQQYRKFNNRKNNKNFRNREEKEFEERVVKINRITKVVKGGRRMRFSALVVVGDKKGRIGFGTGKAKEVPDAIKKASEMARKNIIKVNLVGTTLPHEIVGRYGAAKVVLRPAAEGTGVIAGGPVRAVLELAGVSNVISKCLGSRTPINVVRATCQGLEAMTTIEHVSDLRDMKPNEVRY